MDATFFENIKIFFSYVYAVWWLWLPIVLAIAFFESWIYYIRRVHWQGLNWIVLEIKPPRDNERSPKIMEQVFTGLYGSLGTVTTKYEKYIKGVTQDYFSVEIVGINGTIHFFIRILAKYRNLVEAQIYSQYSQAEIREVDDYVYNVPMDIPNKNWDMWGTRLALTADDSYPLRTYMEHIDVVSGAKIPQFIDPLAGLMEVMTKLQEGEQIWIQVVFRPVGDDWIKKSKALVAKLLLKAKPAQVPEGMAMPMTLLSPGERETLSLIEQKASKKGFEAKIQFAYIGRKEVFSKTNIGATMGLFNQLAMLNANSLRPEKYATTKANYAFAKARKIYKQRRMMKWMRTRSFWEKGYILNIEELATIYHFPTMTVRAPMTPWLESRRAEPPIDLPTI